MILTMLLATAAATHRPHRAAPHVRPDRDTAVWWQETTALAGDALEGRDAGSPGYDAAARIVAAAFAKAGLKPAGANGSFFQTVPMADVTVEPAGTSLTLAGMPLRLLHDYVLRPSSGMPTDLAAGVTFRGYCGADALAGTAGLIVVCYGTHKPGLPSAEARLEAVRKAGAAGILTVADPGFTVEPPRWPWAYARTVTLAGQPAPPEDRMLVGTLKAETFAALASSCGHDGAALIAAGSAGRPLASFDFPGTLIGHITLSHRDLRSDNVLGLLPGTDPKLRSEVVVLSAHLDGYGHGEPVAGDGLYNGALDDAAYVALLQRLAERKAGQGYRRSVLFAAFTGEEKGLLGARYFVRRPTLQGQQIVADINLDQLRPIFPLDLLTVHALTDSTLGDMVRETAARGHIAVQVDPEPERGLLRRADHWPFIDAGIPATGFVFGYRPGSPSERIYRRWYEERYHRPQDDLQQPIDWGAAEKFNSFFYSLVDRVANADAAPAWKPGAALPPARNP